MNIKKIIIQEVVDFNRQYSNIPPGIDRNRIFGGGLDEIGTATSKQYDYTLVDDSGGEFNYEFTTDSNLKYNVDIVYDETDKSIDVSFGVVKIGDGKHEFTSTFEITNLGEMYNIMATVVSIVMDIMDVVDVDIIYFEPSKKDDEYQKDTPLDQTKRFKLYIAYINNVFPNAKVTQVNKVPPQIKVVLNN